MTTLNENIFKEFERKELKLLDILVYLESQSDLPDNIKDCFCDFYIKSIITRSYTYFEDFIRQSLDNLTVTFNEIRYLDGNFLNDNLKRKIINFYYDKLPSKELTLKKIIEKKDVLSVLLQIAEKNLYRIDKDTFNNEQIPESVENLENKLCDYFNKTGILQKIILQKAEEIHGINRLDNESAYVFINRYLSKLRHPVVHKDLITIRSEDDSKIDESTLKVFIGDFILIARELNSVYISYFNDLNKMKSVTPMTSSI